MGECFGRDRRRAGRPARRAAVATSAGSPSTRRPPGSPTPSAPRPGCAARPTSWHEQRRGRHERRRPHRETTTSPTTRTILSTLQASVDQKRASYQSSKLDTCLMTIQSSDCGDAERDQPRRRESPGASRSPRRWSRSGAPARRTTSASTAGATSRPSSTNGEGVCAAFVAAGQSCATAGGPSCGPNAVCDIEGTPDDSSDDLCAAGLRHRRAPAPTISSARASTAARAAAAA